MSDPTMPAALAIRWKRYRFVSDEDDPRPIVFPPPGPYWITGYTADDSATIVAYIPEGIELTDYWPEAQEIELQLAPLTFSSRFPRPDWWQGEAALAQEGTE